MVSVARFMFKKVKFPKVALRYGLCPLGMMDGECLLLGLGQAREISLMMNFTLGGS